MTDGASVNIVQEALPTGLGNQRLRSKKTIKGSWNKYILRTSHDQELKLDVVQARSCCPKAYTQGFGWLGD